MRFAPTLLGPASDVWRIAGEDASGLHEVQFSGEGIAVGGGPGLITPPPGGGSLGFHDVSPQAKLASTKLLASRSGTILVRVSCSSATGPCQGSLILRSAKAYRQRSGRHAVLTLASASFTIASGHSTTIRLHLTVVARRLLAKQHTLRVKATVSTRQAVGAAQVSRSLLTLRAAPGFKAP